MKIEKGAFGKGREEKNKSIDSYIGGFYCFIGPSGLNLVVANFLWTERSETFNPCFMLFVLRSDSIMNNVSFVGVEKWVTQNSSFFFSRIYNETFFQYIIISKPNLLSLDKFFFFLKKR